MNTIDEERIQVDRPLLLDSWRLANNRDYLLSFFDNTRFPGCEAVLDIIARLPQYFDTKKTTIHLPFITKEIGADRLFFLIKEEPMDLRTEEGRLKAARKLALAAHLIWHFMKNRYNHSFTQHRTYIGDFILSEGHRKRLYIFYDAICWKLGCEQYGDYVKPGFWIQSSFEQAN